MPATITQKELAETLESYNVALRQADKFRLLLEAGAEVESGTLKVDTDDELAFSGPCADTPCVSLGGISINAEHAPAAHETQREPLPEWLEETPEDNSYRLYVHDEGGMSLQEIGDITRSEYIALKLHLAKMRGHKITEEEPDDDETPAEGGKESAQPTAEQKCLVVGSDGIAVTYCGFDLGDHDGRSVEYSELLLKDADGDYISSLAPAEELTGKLNVIVHNETDRETAVRLLRKITDAIERNGICLDDYAVHTMNPAVDQIEALRARVIASGGKVEGGEATLGIMRGYAVEGEA